MALSSLVLLVCLLQANAKPAAPVLVLSATGQQREGLPEAVPHPDAGPYLQGLTRGYPSQLLRLYALEQRFVRPDQAPHPGVLVLTDNQGGFPRWGLYLHGAQPNLPYVDLHRRQRPVGFRGVDHIFSHELLHIIVRDLAGAHPEGHASQVHAVAVKTDRITAFNEGFAEHAQLMALGDEAAPPGDAAFDRYRAALGARVAILPKAQITFPVWFSYGEQVQRYDDVRRNAFAREADVPRDLFTTRSAYKAYLLENTLPGAPDGAAKSVSRLLSTEGVVAGLFHRIVTDRAMQEAYVDDAFYSQFGVTSRDVAPLENAYLKVFASIRQGGYDTLAVIRAHERLFPQDREALARITADVFLGQPLTPPAELWLLNDAMRIGTSLFDQYRGLPRPPTFDLNAASRADLVAVPGVDLSLAERIMRGGPYALVDDLQRVDGMTPAVLDRFTAMRRAMLAPPDPGTESEGSLSFSAVLMPYAWRALGAWAICAAIGAVLYGKVRRVRAWRLVLNGIAAAGVTLLAGWTIDPGTGVLAIGTTLGILGLPATVIRGIKTWSVREAATVMIAWTAASLAAVITVTPLFRP